MKIAGFVAAFLAAAVSLWSNVTSDTTLSLPKIVTINIDIFYTCQYKNIFAGGSADAFIDIHSIVSDAQRILEKFTSSFGTTFELKVLRITEFGSCSSTVGEPNWREMKINSANNGNVKADLFLYFTNTKSNQGVRQQVQGKMCDTKRRYRTVRIDRGGSTTINDKLDLIYRSARSLCYFIGRLLGMRADDDGQTAKDGKTACPKGPMNFQGKLNRQQESWNQCNAEDLSDFYVQSGTCFVRPLLNIMIINVHAFYDQAFKVEFGNKKSTVKTEINKVVEEARKMLNKDDYYLGTMFLLNLVAYDQDDSSQTNLKMISISNSQGLDKADLFAFFTYKASYMPIYFKPSVCSGNRAYRTLSLNRNGFTTFGTARQLVYFIGGSLGMDDDWVNKLGDPTCPDEGYMRYKWMGGKVKTTWKQLYAFWNTDKKWTKCNIEDLKAGYAKAATSRVDGPLGRIPIRHCLND